MPTSVECVHHSMELTPQLASKELNANTAFTAVCVRDLVVIMSETGAVYKSGAYSRQSMGEWGVSFVWV